MTVEIPSEKLAIEGGEPLLPPPPAWPPDDDEVREALAAAARDGSWGRYHGPHTEALALALATFHQSEHVTLCCSGTLAVELALRAARIGAGDEVLLAGYDFPGNFRAIEAVGAQPVLVDLERDGWTLDLEQLAAACGPATRAVVASHLHGGLVDMPRLVELAQQRGLVVVEDACQAAGATIAGRPAGSWGHVGVLSFGGSKSLTAGRGGALLTSDAQMHQRAKVYAERGNDAFPLSQLQATVLLPQLRRLAERNARRRESVLRLWQQTADLPALKPLPAHRPGDLPAYYKLAWQYLPQRAGGRSIDDLVAALQAEGVPIDRGFRGFAGRSERRCRKSGSLAESMRAAETTLLLHHPILLESDAVIDLVAQAMAKVLHAFCRHEKPAKLAGDSSA